MTTETKAVTKTEPDAVSTLRGMLVAKKAQIAELVPKHLTPERLMRVALNSVAKTPKLQLCTTSSVLQCVITAAELGLEPGGAMGHAYLVPFKETCQLIIGYRGFIHLIRQSGQLASIRAVIVHKRDLFRPTEGLEQSILHEPCIDGDPGEMVHVYCVAKFKDGGHQVERMTKAQVDKVRARSRSANDGPWITDPDEMAKKTCLRRLAKWLPMSTEVERAFEVDNDDYVDGEVVAQHEAAALPEETATQRAKAALKAKRLVAVDVPTIPEDAVDPATVERELAIQAEVDAKAAPKP